MTTAFDRPAAELRVASLTVAQYEAMLAGGILEEGAPIELLHGLLVRKDRAAAGEDPMTVGPRHSVAVAKANRLAARFERLGFHLRIQAPVRLPPHDEPEADVAVVRGAVEDYLDRHPGPADIASVIEVADSSLRLDRETKLGAYAAAGIRQYVIVNLVDRQVEVHTKPVPAERRYEARAVLAADDPVSIAAGPRRTVKVKARDLLA